MFDERGRDREEGHALELARIAPVQAVDLAAGGRRTSGAAVVRGPIPGPELVVCRAVDVVGQHLVALHGNRRSEVVFS